MRKLPFLNGIRAFEAAARAESFAKAADELHVTPAAISRMVQLLEQRLGVPLFERKANRLALTAAGRAYQAGLTQIFDQLANLTAQVTAMAGSRVLTVGVGPTFADALAHSAARRFPEGGAGDRGALRHRRRDGAVQRRLDLRHPARRRRLAGFHRGAAVRRRSHAGLLARDGEAAEVAGRSAECDAAARRACRRRMAALVQGRRAVEDPRARDRSSNTTARPCRPPPTASALRSASAPMSTTTSKAGRLVAPFAQSVSKGEHWYLIYRDGRKDEAAFRAFRAWIVRAAAQDVKRTAPSARASPACRAASPCSTCTSP